MANHLFYLPLAELPPALALALALGGGNSRILTTCAELRSELGDPVG